MTGGKASLPVRARDYTPSEFAGALTEAGVRRCERWVQLCTNLPAAHPRHIKTVSTSAALSGRKLIPESELFRLLGIKSEAEA